MIDRNHFPKHVWIDGYDNPNFVTLCHKWEAQLYVRADLVDLNQMQAYFLFITSWVEAEKAMRKFPQPNYVISKVAEEVGEVVKAAIHCAEGRETPDNLVAEITQAMAMLIRLYLEGDQVHGLPAPAAINGGDNG